MAMPVVWLTTVKHVVATVCGLILMAVPLALWVAWSGTVLVVVLATGAVAGVLCVLLAEDPDPRPVDRRHVPLHAARASLSDEFMAELTGIGPWIYHNRLSATASFKAKMDRLRRLLDDDTE